MKPGEDNDTEEAETNASVTGDVIGDTAYSERFVLKILLKLANLDTLEDELKDKSFEDDLCVLWDMTAEKDVDEFLLKHDVLNLFSFALPAIESTRILEIIIGIIANMCCHRKSVVEFSKDERLLNLIFEHLRSDDSQVLIQLLRLVSSCLFLADGDELKMWMNIFDNIEYAKSLYFIMKNSTNKELLVTAIENFNTLCSYCNTEKFRASFFSQFVTKNALDSVSSAFNELTANQKEPCEKDEMERIFVVTLQLAMNLVGFDKSREIYNSNREGVVEVINYILKYYETKFVDRKDFGTDIVDIFESTNTVLSVLQIGETAGPDQFFMPSYNMWKVLVTAEREEQQNQEEKLTEEKREVNEIKKTSDEMINSLSTLMCIYMAQCTDENLVKALDNIGNDYDNILKGINDKELKDKVSNRAANYRTRLKDNVDV